ncbi:hypothetical protein PO909_006355 [Leuciscus waleckii]
MSKWVVEAISLAYEAAGQPSPLAFRSHSTRSMAASKALISGVSLQDVCDAAGWSSPHTFARFYSLDLDSTPGSQIQSEDWFVTIDLKDTYFHVSIHPHHRKFLRFAFGGEAYQYWVLPFGLGLSPRIFTKCMDAALAPLRLQGIRVLNYLDDWLILAQSEQLAVRHRDVVLSHIKRFGLWLNAKKSVLLPAQRTPFLGVLWDSTIMQARLSPARISAILTAVKGVKLGQSLTVKQFQRLLGLMAAASNVITFGLLYMRPLQWWLRIKGFSPRGNPFRTIKVTRRCLRALVMWKKPWFLAQGPVLGASCPRVTLSTDAS